MNDTVCKPEAWAYEGMSILEGSLVSAVRIHRDFEDEAHKPQDVVVIDHPEDGSSVDVPLNQHFYCAFDVTLDEAQKPFQELVDTYLQPGMLVMARGIEKMILGRAPAFLHNQVGRLGHLTAGNIEVALSAAYGRLNDGRSPLEGRTLVLSPDNESSFLKYAGNRDHVLHFTAYMDQNVNWVSKNGCDVVVGILNREHVAEQTRLTVAGLPPVLPGQYVVVAGDEQVTYVIRAGDADITLSRPLRFNIPDRANVTVYRPCSVEGIYPAGHSAAIKINGWSKPLQIGQLVSFGRYHERRHTYTVTEAEVAAGTQSIFLDRPLDRDVCNEPCFPGPAGALNLAFHHDALGLVCRPLALPPLADKLIRSSVSVLNNLALRASLRVNETYDKITVTLDFLCGLSVLNDARGVVLLG